jgi:transcriptional regulator GlxA family with amidase domain
MTPVAATTTTEEVRFLLVPGFSLIAFTSALEPMRLANRIAGRELYRWRLLSRDGRPITSGDGVAVGVAGSIERTPAGVPPAPTIVLCGGPGCERHQDPEVVAWLRRWARFGATIGALGSTAHLLARAGLLAGYRCTTHWQSLPAFAEAFPELETTGNLFEIDRERFTCAGGAAALDLTLHRLTAAHGPALAAGSEACLLDRVRAPDEPQRRPWHVRLGARHPKLIQAVQLMEARIEDPLSQAALARRVGLSRRQVERLFQRHLGRTPSQHYLGVRLERARVLLAETDLPVVGVACATGFVSASHFATCYRQHFGRTPRMERLRVA